MDLVDVNWEIRVLRTFRRYGSMRYGELLHRLGDPTRTSRAVNRLQRAGFLASDARRLVLTGAGRAALDRIDDPATRQRVLTELLYGHRRRPDHPGRPPPPAGRGR
jgi:DNA-binding IclR family transcriptional regulator